MLSFPPSLVQHLFPRLPRSQPSAVVISHPGHELRIYGWLAKNKPKVYVLTDGSGRFNSPRLDSTTKVLKELGLSMGSIYGRFTDKDFYSAMLEHDFNYIVINNIPLSKAHRDRLCVQQVNPAIYAASYPCWLLHSDKLLALLQKKYHIFLRYKTDLSIRVDGKIIPYEGNNS